MICANVRSNALEIIGDQCDGKELETLKGYFHLHLAIKMMIFLFLPLPFNLLEGNL